ncbi:MULTISPECIES: tyrosine-type recombinase/integrase [unclassified Novosphingobium]|uniref:tyrosine-type recombinase/integrase n=1 Tax=unclassified Novosphingobium TaxID=2644732 RepID=UPI000B2FDD68|nr:MULTISPECIES: integrase arm-type DNA-binding domain-containing protein [unclassified Novosphingobium]
MAGFSKISLPNRSRCFAIHLPLFGGIGRGTRIGQRGYPILTDAKCRTAKGGDKPYKLSDAHGLYLFVSTSGHRSWRWKYRIGGREKVLTIGAYPAVSLAQARVSREEAARSLAAGFDPSRSKKQQAAETFEAVAKIWHRKRKDFLSDKHAAKILRSLEKDVFPIIGHLPIAKIRPAHILEVLNPIEERRAFDQAHRMRQRMSDVFVFAVSSGLAEIDPAGMMRKALHAVPKRNYPALTSIEEARALLIAESNLNGWPHTKLASRLIALTAVRSEPLRYAEPSEFEGLDTSEPIWRIPAGKMKLGKEQRKQQAFEFIVPLPRQAVEIVKLAIELTHGGPYLFPNTRFPTKPISDNAISKRYRDLGYSGRHVPHGWRSTFSTIMNERAERLWRAAGHTDASPDRAIIDLMLAHQQEGVEPIYNRAAYMERRRELAQEWADLLCEGLPPALSLLTLTPRN